MIATFALAIGANTAIFSLLNPIVLRAVSVSDPDRLIAISTTDTQTTQLGFIYADTFRAFRAQQRSFATLSMSSGGFSRVSTHVAPPSTPAAWTVSRPSTLPWSEPGWRRAAS